MCNNQMDDLQKRVEALEAQQKEMKRQLTSLGGFNDNGVCTTSSCRRVRIRNSRYCANCDPEFFNKVEELRSVKNGKEFADIRDWIDDNIDDINDYRYLQAILYKKYIDLEDEIAEYDGGIDDKEFTLEISARYETHSHQ